MKEERMMILQMVADGKISPEEGATLLEAIGDKKPKVNTKSQFEDRSWRPSFGFDFFEDPFKEGFDSSPQVVAVADGTQLAIKNHTGPLTLVGCSGSEIKVSGASRGQYKLVQNNDNVAIKVGWVGVPLTVEIPRAVTQLSVQSHVGHIEGKNLPNSLQNVEIKTHTGKISLDTETLKTGNFKLQSKVGQIEFCLPKESACSINALYKMGAIDTDLPLTVTEEGVGFLKGTLNDGGAEIWLGTHMGHIAIKGK